MSTRRIALLAAVASLLMLAFVPPVGARVEAATQTVNGPFVRTGQTGTPLTRFCTPSQVAPPSAPPGKANGGPGGMPAPDISFVGAHHQSFVTFGGDISGAAGPHNYVETVNTAISIFNRAGELLCPEVDTQRLWDGSHTACDISNVSYTDAIVLYDQFAHRWFIGRFINDRPQDNSGNWWQCIAVSQTTDPTAGYFRYAFEESSQRFPYFNDYEKFGVWRDAYYMTANANKIFNPDGRGIFVVAFDRSRMLQGKSARQVLFFLPRTANSGEARSMMQPANVDGPTLPPSGSPEYLAQTLDTNDGWPADQLNIWNFHVNWTTPGSSTLKLSSALKVNPFDSNLCEPTSQTFAFNQSCFPQPGTSVKLDPVAYGYIGYRLVYRSFATAPKGLTHHVMVLAQTVAVGSNTSHAGIRWYILGQLAGTGGPPWKILQQATYAPDALNRWLPSPGIDSKGDVALGFQVGGAKLFPSAGYVGRMPGDPANTMPRHEARAVTGKGAQTNNGFFGDYTQMTTDPTNDCRLWYAAEYYPDTTAGGSESFVTAVSSFRFSGCTG